MTEFLLDWATVALFMGGIFGGIFISVIAGRWVVDRISRLPEWAELLVTLLIVSLGITVLIHIWLP